MGLLVLLAGAGHAATSCPDQVEKRIAACQPSEVERGELLQAIRAANERYENYHSSLLKERRSRGRYLLEENPRNANAAEQRLLRLQEWRENLADVERLEPEMQEAFRALSLRIGRAYGVSPRSEESHVAGGLLRGAAASWAPAMQEAQDGYFYSQREVGVLPFGRGKKAAYMKYESLDARDAKNPEERQSATLDDGTVLISIRLFRLSQNSNGGKGDPAILAAHLAMERSRFEEKTCSSGNLGCRLQRSRDDLRADAVEIRGINAALAAAEAIGLGPTYKARLDSRRATLALRLDKAARGEIVESPAFMTDLESNANMIDWGKFQAQLRGIRRQQGQLSRRLEARRRGEPEEPFLRDALNERHLPEEATTDDGCSSTGIWAGDVYFPAMPCARTLPQPTETGTVPAVPIAPVPSVPALTAPAPVRAVVSLSTLAERICANPGQAHSQAFHDDYKDSWINPNDDPTAMPKCRGEVFLVLKRITRERSPDYNSDYFQSLAESLNAPQPAVFVPPEPEVDYPVPYGPGVPDCLRAEGRRCVRWR